MTGNAVTSLSEQVESILSSTSTGTISPSEEKIRDLKNGSVDGNGDETGGADGAKNALSKITPMDLDKEVSLIQQFCLAETNNPNLEITGLYPAPDGQRLLVICKDTGGKQQQPPANESEEHLSGLLFLVKINLKGPVVYLDEIPVEQRVFTSAAAVPVELVMLPMFLKHDEAYLPNSHVPMGVLLLSSGELQLIKLTNLETVSVFRNEGDCRFVSVAYCDRKYGVVYVFFFFLWVARLLCEGNDVYVRRFGKALRVRRGRKTALHIGYR